MNSYKTVAFYTLGCKVNQYETESMKNQLSNEGYEILSFDEKSDIYIVNTCTVTSIADSKSRKYLRRAKALNPKSILIVTGCYAETNAKELDKIEEIDYIFGNDEKNSIADFIKNLQKNIENTEKSSKIQSGNIFTATKYEELPFAKMREMSRAYIKVQDGCNNFCTYCKIPFARGKSRSRELASILHEVEQIARENYREIIIIGINLGDYGRDLTPQITFEDMLESVISKVRDIGIITRIRIGSVYPDKINDRFIELFANKELMPHIHLSLQSMNADVLRAMGRKYTPQDVISRLSSMRESIPNMEFTGDLIVGFPGETEEMFADTCNNIRELGFANLHIFPYSERENTRAAHMPDKVPQNIKKERVQRLSQIVAESAKKVRESYVGKTLQVLIEEEKNKKYCGYSENYLYVYTRDKSNMNDIKKMTITAVEKEMLIGNEC